MCSGCRNLKFGENAFDINLKTKEYYKSCNKCRERDKLRKINNNEQIKENARKHYQGVREAN